MTITAMTIHRQRSRPKDLVFFGGLAIIAGVCLLAQSALGADPGPGDSQAKNAANEYTTVLGRFAEFSKGLDTFSVDMTSSVLIETNRLRQNIVEISRLSAARPDKVSLVLSKGLAGPTVVFDGAETSTYLPRLHQYTQLPGPDNIDQLFAPSNRTGESLQQAMPLLPLLLVPGEWDWFLNATKNGQYLGQMEISEEQNLCLAGGIECHHLKVPLYGHKWDILIEAGPKPLLRKISISVSQWSEKITATWTFCNWNIGGPHPEDAFVPRLPDSAAKVDKFRQPTGRASHPMIGKDAPDFDLPLLDGGRASLSSHKGKDVVILDFWASWCGYCIQGMPNLISVMERYKDKPVTLYAINVRESAERAGQTLKSRNWKMAVPLDDSGRLANRYGASGLPYTVIVDTKGKIAHVHAGLLPNMKEQLIADIDSLLGKAANHGNYDLVCKSAKMSPESAKTGEPISFRCVLANLGTDTIKAGSADISLVIENVETYIGTLTDDIAPSGELEIVLGKESWNIALLQPGKFDYTLQVDLEDRLAETNEQNNIFSGTLNISSAND